MNTPLPASPLLRSPENSSAERLHSLDALRAFALLLGVVFHSALVFVLPPGVWAVGTDHPSSALGWFVYYSHCFRLELFFLLAGFFARLVIEKRGVRPFARDRARRILLVFVLALYPMKIMLGAVWVWGGLKTGWLKLPPEVAKLPLWQLALGSLTIESWPKINLTHLWFLYYLACITALFLAARWFALRVVGHKIAIWGVMDRAFGFLFSRWWTPLPLALLTTPIVAMMPTADVDTPDGGFAWKMPVLLLYGFFFGAGWMFHRQSDLLVFLARRSIVFLLAGLAVSLGGAIGSAVRMSGDPWVAQNAIAVRWITSFGTSFTMALAVLGWIGLFVRWFNQPSPWARYVADSSYWIYIAHLPLVTALQVWMVGWKLPWWINVPLTNIIAFPILFWSYDRCVRYTWVGALLNGRRNRE